MQTVVAGYLVDQLYANVDVPGELREALPPRAQPLAAPAAGALRRGAEEVAQRALDRPRVQAAWEQANRRAHAALVQVVEGGGDVVSTEQGTVTLDLKALLDEIAGRTGVGSRVAGAAARRAPPRSRSCAPTSCRRSSRSATRSSRSRSCSRCSRWRASPAAIALVPGPPPRGAARERVGVRRSPGSPCSSCASSPARRSSTSSRRTASVRPAAESAWRIGTSLLAGVAVAAIAYGLIAVAGAWLAGPTRIAVQVRGRVAPYMRDARVAYGALAAVVLLVLLWGPTEGTRRLLPALLLLVLVVTGFEVLRRQMRREPPAVGPATARGGDGGAPGVSENALAQLERLAALHRSGQLDDEEFNAAKQRVLTPA